MFPLSPYGESETLPIAVANDAKPEAEQPPYDHLPG